MRARGTGDIQRLSAEGFLRRVFPIMAIAASAALAICLLAALPGRACAIDQSSIESSSTLRVGYFYNTDYMHKDADGNYEGYDIEYIYKLAGYANMRVQFVEFDSLKDSLDALQAGEIDVLPDMAKTDERLSTYMFSSQPMSTSHVYVLARSDDDRFTFGDPACLNNASVAILRNTLSVTQYREWCAQNNVTPNIVEVDGMKQRNQMLANGEVDAVAGGSTLEGSQRIVEFAAQDLFFMFNKYGTEAKSKVDRALGQLIYDDPTYPMTLRQKYFPVSKNDAATFNDQEQAYLNGHPIVRVAVLKSDAPFSTVDARGSASGIVETFYDHMAEHMGVQMEYVPYESRADEIAAVNAGEVDMVGAVQSDEYGANGQNIILTEAVMQMSMVRVTRSGAGEPASVAATTCTVELVANQVKAMGKDLTLTECSNGEECFTMMNSGQVDAVVCPQGTASWYLNNNRRADYSVSEFGTTEWVVSAATAKSADGSTLRTIINKVLAVDEGYINQVVAAKTTETPNNLTAIINRAPVVYIVGAAVLMMIAAAIVVAAGIVIARRRKHELALAAQQLEVDRHEARLKAEAKSNQLRHAFFSTVSHDMRTPLNGIIGFTNMALQSGSEAGQRDYLGKIRASSFILRDLINDTLDMSRIESGKMVLHEQPHDNLELMRSVSEPMGVLAEEAGIRFTVNVDTVHQRTVLVDRLALQKILLNLISNAVKFTPRGGAVTCQVRLDPADGNDPDTVFVISDTGIGMSDEFAAHAFDPFTQESAQDAGQVGTGLGLSIVKNLVKAMGGTIDLKTEQGSGTTFTVRVHLKETKEPPLPVGYDGTLDADARDGEHGARASLAGKKVLVCEDNAMNLEIMKSMLTGSGMQPVGAPNGKEGLDAFAASEPGEFFAVLLDLRMPVMDGIEAARAIRALDRPDAKTVIMLAVSADAYPENVAECLAAGMDGHIAKPVDAKELMRALASTAAAR